MDTNYRFHRDWDSILAHYLNPIRLRCLALKFPPQSWRRKVVLTLGKWYNNFYWTVAKKGMATRVLLCTLSIKIIFLPIK